MPTTSEAGGYPPANCTTTEAVARWQARQRAQLPFRQFRRKADRLILSTGTHADLRRKLAAFWKRHVLESD